GSGVERVTQRGVVVAGGEDAPACLGFATGFEGGTAYTRRAGYEIHGRGGATPPTRRKDGGRPAHRTASRRCPDCFIMGPQQAGFTVNYPHMLNEQSKHLAYIVRQAVERGVRTVEVSEEAEQEWVDTVIRLARFSRQFLEDCTPGYYNNEGHPGAL